MAESKVKLSINDGIAQVTLSRPQKHNALNMDMFRALDNVISQIGKNKMIRVVIVTGAGESFCSGLDIKSVLSNPRNALSLLWKWLPGNPNLAQRVSIGWRRLNVPVIMALHGNCWGGGMQIALGADFRIAAPDCSLSIMEARWGLIPDMGGTIGLNECVAIDQAMKLAMSAETLDAQSALSIGLITQVAADPLQSAQQLAQQLVDRSPDTNQAIKKMYHSVWSKNNWRNERQILAKETWQQIKILLRKNQKIAVKRELGNKDISYKI
ncbi:MAG: crotonase/enoyl-CoA hydratase family protein [Parashewanella sp.]